MIWNVVGQIVSTGFKVMQTRSQTKQVKAMAEQKHYERMLDGKIEYEIFASYLYVLISNISPLIVEV